MPEEILLRQDDYDSLQKFEEDFYYKLNLTTYQFKRKCVKKEAEKIDTWILDKYRLDYHKELNLYLLSEILPEIPIAESKKSKKKK